MSSKKYTRYRPELWDDSKRQVKLDENMAKWFTWLVKKGYMKEVEETNENGQKIVKLGHTELSEGYLGTDKARDDWLWFLETGQLPD